MHSKVTKLLNSNHLRNLFYQSYYSVIDDLFLTRQSTLTEVLSPYQGERQKEVGL
jgi:hypothetical protein